MGMRDREYPAKEGGGKAMKQPRTDYGISGETGEREPRRADAADKRGERRERLKGGVAVGEADRMGVQYGVGRPEHHMGKHDGRLGEFNDGKMDEGRVAYEHERLPHAQD